MHDKYRISKSCQKNLELFIFSKKILYQNSENLGKQTKRKYDNMIHIQ